MLTRLFLKKFINLICVYTLASLCIFTPCSSEKGVFPTEIAKPIITFSSLNLSKVSLSPFLVERTFI